MTNCKMCEFELNKVKEKDSEKYRCKESGLQIKEFEIPNRCKSFKISDYGKQIEREIQRDKELDEKYWREKFEMGKEVPENYLKKFQNEKKI